MHESWFTKHLGERTTCIPLSSQLFSKEASLHRSKANGARRSTELPFEAWLCRREHVAEKTLWISPLFLSIWGGGGVLSDSRGGENREREDDQIAPASGRQERAGDLEGADGLGNRSGLHPMQAQRCADGGDPSDLGRKDEEAWLVSRSVPGKGSNSQAGIWNRRVQVSRVGFSYCVNHPLIQQNQQEL